MLSKTTLQERYLKWLESKIEIEDKASGFEVKPGDLHPALFHHQKVTVEWALSRGRALIAKRFGLGKTLDQCEIARQVLNHVGHGKFLVVAPLSVKHQFAEEDGPRLGQVWQYVRTDAEIEAAQTPYLITNYERVREGDIDPRKHDIVGCSLDEGSVLRSFGSKTYHVFEEAFAAIPYRFVATATPDPNDYKELIYYAQFLGIADTGQLLTRYFQRDSTKAGRLTLYPHHEKSFWLWVSSWALFLYQPSDVGGDDAGYILPDLNIHWHRVEVDHSRAWEQTDDRGQARLFLDAANGVREAVAEKRATMSARVDKMTGIMAENPSRHWLLWHHLEDERRMVEKAVPEAVSVYGSLDLEERERRILAFSRGQISILATKPEVSGSGCNFQKFCYSNIFLGVDYRFEDFIQAIYRTQRYGQNQPVDVHIIYAESEEEVVSILKRKWRKHDQQAARMQEIVKKYGLSSEALKFDLRRQIGVHRQVETGSLFTAVNNDCILEMSHIEDDSVGLIHTSIPFGNHYEYTTQVEDFGHNPSNAQFWEQMDFLIPELLRVAMPGRCAAIHVKDRVLYGYQTPSGFMEISPFSDECVAAFRKHGWLYAGRRTVTTDVVYENNQTYRLGWSEVCKDASKMGCGSPEYLLLFRKPPTDKSNAYADQPIVKDKADYTRARWQIDADAPWRSSGNRLLTPEEYAQMVDLRLVSSLFEAEQMEQVYDYERHVEIAQALEAKGHLPATYSLLPVKTTRCDEDMVWDDIVRMRVLNSNQAQRRVESHICPLPLDIVRRTIRLYSNPGDLILDPFAGLHTVPFVAIGMGRCGYGVELHPEYWAHGVRYCKEAEIKARTPMLFDLTEVEAAG